MEHAPSQIKSAVIEALHEVLSYPNDGERGTMLVQRIPLICQDIRAIKEDLKEVRENTTWAVRIVVGAVLLALMKIILIP